MKFAAILPLKIVIPVLTIVFMVGMKARAESPPDIGNIPPSITDQQEFNFYNTGIFLSCKNAPTEARRYELRTKPSTNQNYEIVQTLIDLTSWIHIDGFSEPMESHSGDLLQKAEVRGPRTVLTMNRGSISLKRDVETGVLGGVMDFDDAKAVQLSCEPAIVLCQSLNREEGRTFFVKLESSKDGLEASLTYDFTPEGFSGPVTGHTLMKVQANSTMTSGHYVLQGESGIKGRLRFHWKGSRGFLGTISFSEPSLKVVISNAPVSCRQGI